MSRNLLQLSSDRNYPGFYVSTIDPAAAQSAITGYLKGAMWVNTVGSTVYVLTDEVTPVWTLVNSVLIKNNFIATSIPTNSANTSLGYSTGSLWVDTITNLAYICVAATSTTSSWFEITDPKSNYTATTSPSIGNDSSQGYSLGSMWVDTTRDLVYFAVDVSPGAAVWTSGGGLAGVSNVFPTAPNVGQIFHNTSVDLTYLWDGNSWIDIAAAGGTNVKHNYSATTSPGTSDDSSNQYSVGSIWLDLSSTSAYIAFSVAIGAASWFKISKDPTWKTIAASYTASSGDSLFVDTMLSPVSITLPASPSNGDFVKFVDNKSTFATNNLVVVRNGVTIMGSATDMVVATSNERFTLTYNGFDWRVTT